MDTWIFGEINIFPPHFFYTILPKVIRTLLNPHFYPYANKKWRKLVELRVVSEFHDDLQCFHFSFIPIQLRINLLVFLWFFFIGYRERVPILFCLNSIWFTTLCLILVTLVIHATFPCSSIRHLHIHTHIFYSCYFFFRLLIYWLHIYFFAYCKFILFSHHLLATYYLTANKQFFISCILLVPVAL